MLLISVFALSHIHWLTFQASLALFLNTGSWESQREKDRKKQKQRETLTRRPGSIEVTCVLISILSTTKVISLSGRKTICHKNQLTCHDTSYLDLKRAGIWYSVGPACCWSRFDSQVQQGIFLPEPTFSADSLTVSIQPSCATACINICAHPKHWHMKILHALFIRNG